MNNSDCHYHNDNGSCNLFDELCVNRPQCVPTPPLQGQDELIEPISPIRANFFSDGEYIKARKIYKTDRTRYLKDLKHRDSGSVLVDHSIAQFKTNKKYRTMKDSQWRAEQENEIPQATITKYLMCRWVNCKKARFPGQIYCKEHSDFSNKIALRIEEKENKKKVKNHK